MKQSVILVFLLLIVQHAFAQPGKLSPGDDAIDFSLRTIHGEEFSLSELNETNPVVLIVLRGWPGYQCPICTRQVSGLIEVADELTEHDAKVVFVYPGPSEKLQNHAKEFSEDFKFPENFYFTLDPDYSMVNKYGLRWDAAKETAYPSTYIINKNGKVVFAKVSETHGGRAEVEEILEALENSK